MLAKMVFGIFLSTLVAAAPLSAEDLAAIWQGEWGDVKTVSDGRQSGAFFSIQACGAGTCNGYYQTFSESGACYGRIKVSLKDSVSASAVALKFQDNPAQCSFDLTREDDGTSLTLKIKRSGPECASYCSKDYFPENYPLFQRASIVRNWDLKCYTDSRRAFKAWCQSAELQEVFKRLDATTSNIKSYSDNSEELNPYTFLHDAINACDANEPAQCIKAKLLPETERLERAFLAQKTRYENPGSESESAALIDTISGVYKRRFANALVDGSSYESEDVLEIVRVADNAIYFKTRLEFYNGHACSLFGIAEYRAVGGFVYVDSGNSVEGEPCRLTLYKKGDRIGLRDPGSVCRQTSCGARGAYSDTEFTLSDRRAIRYMKTILASKDYKSSLAGYQELIKSKKH